MIKINLLKNTVLTSGSASQEQKSDVPNEVKKLALIKALAILALPLFIYSFEQVNLSNKREKLTKTNETLTKLNQEKAKYGDAAPRIERYTKEKERIDGEIEVIRNLARARLREVKTLDTIQTLMPPDAWAKKITIEGNYVRMEGYSSSEEGTSNLIRALENSPFFSRVQPRRVAQEKSSEVLKRFEIEFRIGRND